MEGIPKNEKESNPNNLELVSVIKELKGVTIINKERLNNLSTIDTLVIVGSSGVGKSTLVDALRNEFGDICPWVITFPKRPITRPKREGDNMEENIHTTEEELQKEIDFSNKIYLIDPDSMSQRRMMRDMHKQKEFIYWEREMEEGRMTTYAFEAPSIFNQLKVLSANNAFGEQNYNSERFENALFIGITAPEEDRESRLLERSPDMNKAEREKRLSDLAENVKGYTDITIENANNDREQPLREIKKLFFVLAKQALERHSKRSPFEELARQSLFTSIPKSGETIYLDDYTKMITESLKEKDPELYQQCLDIIEKRKKRYQDFLEQNG